LDGFGDDLDVVVGEIEVSELVQHGKLAWDLVQLVVGEIEVGEEGMVQAQPG